MGSENTNFNAMAGFRACEAEMTLQLFISSISSNIFSIFINLFPTLIAFFQKTSAETTMENYVCVCCGEADKVELELKTLD